MVDIVGRRVSVSEFVVLNANTWKLFIRLLFNYMDSKILCFDVEVCFCKKPFNLYYLLLKVRCLLDAYLNFVE